MSLSDLADLNQMSSNSGVYVGQTIKVPAGSTVPETYVVQSGDSLSAIASKYNLSQDNLANLNGIGRNANVRVGQRLKLTGEVAEVEKESTITAAEKDIHVVKSGETFGSIAKKYHLQLSYLAALNDLSTNAPLRIGQRLKVDGDLPTKTTVKADSSPKKSSVSSKDTEKYTVKSGESLNLIASRVGISVSELASLNDLSPRTGLQVGQIILIPKTVKDYKVRSGDNLIRLAARYGVEASALAEMNDMKPSAQLKIGDVIKVPNL
jgi:LysM repeat protein